MAEQSHITMGGVPEGFDARILLDELARADAPVVHVARDDKRLAAVAAALRFFDPSVPVLTFPGWDCLPYDRVSPNAAILATRMSTLAALHAGLPGPFILLSTLSAATQFVPPRAMLAGASFTADVGGRIDEDALRAFLVRMGYAQTPTVTEPGDYAVRGGIIDVWPPGVASPVRLDLFGDVLDGARSFDPATQRTAETLSRVEFAPMSEIVLDEAAITRFRQNYRIEFGAAGTDDPLYEAVSAGRKHAGMEHWLPFFHDKLETLFDHVPGATITLDQQNDAQRDARWEQIEDQYDARREAQAQKGGAVSVYKPCPPGLLYQDSAAWDVAIDGHRVVAFHPLPQAPGPGLVDAGGRVGRNFAPERQQESLSLFGALADHVKERAASGPVVIASFSDGARERLSGLLSDEGLDGLRDVDRADQLGGAGSVNLAVWPLEEGFTGGGLTVISEQDVLGDRLIRPKRKTKRAENYLTEAQSLSPGDLIVHVDHGVGRYKGLETVTAAGAPHECIALEYAGGDRLFLPVENIELLSRYGHEEGLLDRLGGGAWQAKKAKLKQRIREIADKLIRIAAERELRSAPVMAPPGEMWEAFAARFPYEETDDQLSAIGDGAGDDHLVRVAATPRADAARDQLVLLVVEEDDAAVGRQELEGGVEDFHEGRVDVELDADGPRELVADPELLVVAAQGVRVLDQTLGEEALVDGAGRASSGCGSPPSPARWSRFDLLTGGGCGPGGPAPCSVPLRDARHGLRLPGERLAGGGLRRCGRLAGQRLGRCGRRGGPHRVGRRLLRGRVLERGRHRIRMRGRMPRRRVPRVEDDPGRAQHDLVARVEDALGDALSVDVGPVQRTEVAQQVAAVDQVEVAVLLRDDAVEDLDRVVRMAAQRVVAAEVDFLAALGTDDRQTRHVEGDARDEPSQADFDSKADS